jgi:hypothetical protein
MLMLEVPIAHCFAAADAANGLALDRPTIEHGSASSLANLPRDGRKKNNM